MRTRQVWSDMRSDIRRLIRETDATLSFWSDADLLLLINEERDLLFTILSNHHEGYNVERVTADLVADQAYYSLPEDTSRVIKVVRVDSSGREMPLTRMERWTESSPGQSEGSGDNYFPTYQLLGEFIFLTPAPVSAQTDGLRIYYEVSLDRLVEDSDSVIPLNWPPEAESYLKFATAVSAFDMEGAQGPLPDGLYQSYVRKRTELLNQMVDTFEQRSWGKVYSTPFMMFD